MFTSQRHSNNVAREIRGQTVVSHLKDEGSERNMTGPVAEDMGNNLRVKVQNEGH